MNFITIYLLDLTRKYSIKSFLQFFADTNFLRSCVMKKVFKNHPHKVLWIHTQVLMQAQLSNHSNLPFLYEYIKGLPEHELFGAGGNQPI